MLRADPGHVALGSTLIGGMLFGLSRNVATEFSFFLGVPTLAAASVYSLWKERALLSTADIPVFAVGMVVSFIVALVVIRWLIRFVATHSLRVFAWYRLAFGALILAAGAFGWVSWPQAWRNAVANNPSSARTTIISTAPRLKRTKPTSAATAISTAGTSDVPPRPCGQNVCCAKNTASEPMTPTTAAVMPVSGACSLSDCRVLSMNGAPAKIIRKLGRKV